MTTPYPTPTCCPTTDSPLSTTSSIIGILTFALGLFASYVALHTSTRSAPTQIGRLIADLRSTQHEINRVAEYIFSDYHNGPSDGNLVGVSYYDSLLFEEVQVLLRDCTRLFYEADELLKRSEREPERLWKRVQFLMRKDEVGEKVARLAVLTGRLNSIQNSLFLKYVLTTQLS
ncbi:MAG: hypothetical protein Q9191_000534 [Dirinaria sp. TL-2023a]